MTEQFTFDESSHIYRVGTRELPGHTRVLDHGGLINYSFVRSDILERRTEIGREVHKATHLFDKGTLDWFSLDERIVPYVEQWREICRVLKFKPILREHRCLCEVNGMQYGMTLDANGIIGKRDALVEIKTTSTIMPHHHVQTAGQALGLPKANIKDALARFLTRERYVVQLTGTGSPRIQQGTDKDDAHAFMSALWLSQWKRRYEKIYREEMEMI